MLNKLTVHLFHIHLAFDFCSASQIHATKLKENSFWTSVHEEELERKELLSEISELFASKAPTRQFGSSVDGEAAEEKKKKTELKVLDAKSAQNLCKTTFANLYAI